MNCRINPEFIPRELRDESKRVLCLKINLKEKNFSRKVSPDAIGRDGRIFIERAMTRSRSNTCFEFPTDVCESFKSVFLRHFPMR